MTYKIDHIKQEEYPEVVEVWEASVRATHDFLKESDIQFFKPLILNEYLKAVDLRCIRGESDQVVAFSGVADGNLEMLFIHPDHRGKKMGKALLDYVINQQAVRKVDVNEQNAQALGFYLKQGFGVKSRSEVDGMGKPYPLLHMELEEWNRDI